MLKFNEKTMRKAVVVEEFEVEDGNFCIARCGISDSVTATPKMEVWVFNEYKCDSYGGVEMYLCWLPEFGFATAISSKLIGFIPTETPEEREALDMIDTTSKQIESLAKSDVVEWDGEGLPPVGVECEIYTYDSPVGVDSMSWYVARVLSIHDAGFGAENIVTYTCGWDSNFYVDAHPAANLKFRKPESPEQKAERERREEAAEMIQCLLDNYTECEESAVDYVLEYLHECDYRKAK